MANDSVEVTVGATIGVTGTVGTVLGTISAPTETTFGKSELEIACQLADEIKVYIQTDGEIEGKYLAQKIEAEKEANPQASMYSIFISIANQVDKVTGGNTDVACI